MRQSAQSHRGVDRDCMDEMRRSFRVLTDRLSEEQVLELSDLLHDALRRRRGGRSFTSDPEMRL